MTKIVVLGLTLLSLTGCYVPSGVYRLTEARFNGVLQPDDNCVAMVVKDNVLTCMPGKRNESW